MSPRKAVWYGVLRPMPRPRVNRRGGVGFPAAYRVHLRALKEALAIQLAPPAPGKGVHLVVVVGKPCSPISRTFGDIDNLLKTVFEALPYDDALVRSCLVTKMRSTTPFLEVIQHDVATDAS